MEKEEEREEGKEGENKIKNKSLRGTFWSLSVVVLE